MNIDVSISSCFIIPLCYCGDRHFFFIFYFFGTVWLPVTKMLFIDVLFSTFISWVLEAISLSKSVAMLLLLPILSLYILCSIHVVDISFMIVIVKIIVVYATIVLAAVNKQFISHFLIPVFSDFSGQTALKRRKCEGENRRNPADFFKIKEHKKEKYSSPSTICFFSSRIILRFILQLIFFLTRHTLIWFFILY